VRPPSPRGVEHTAAARFSFSDGGVTNDVAWRPARELVEGVEPPFPEQLVAYLA